MTALTLPARPEEEEEDSQPLPWRRMAWVTWRQHRVALAGVATLLGALAVYLWITGLSMHHAYAPALTCRPASSDTCEGMVGLLNTNYLSTAEVLAALFQAVPPLIGAFVGGPLLARELETGTFRYAWTQGFGRWRWTLAKLAPLAVAVTAASWAFSVLFSWYYQPFLSLGQQNPFAPYLFDLRGVAFAGWTLAAFAIGALAGMLIRRVVPALVATLAVYAALAFTATLYLRQHYLTPLVTSSQNLSGSTWIIGKWWTHGSHVIGSQPPASAILQYCPPEQFGKGSGGVVNGQIVPVAQCLAPHGYTMWISYQPASRFWPFQWIEGGWLLALSVLLIAATVWLVRRRAA